MRWTRVFVLAFLRESKGEAAVAPRKQRGLITIFAERQRHARIVIFAERKATKSLCGAERWSRPRMIPDHTLRTSRYTTRVISTYVDQDRSPVVVSPVTATRCVAAHAAGGDVS